MEFLHRNSDQILEWDAQRGDGVTVTRGVYGKIECGSKCRGLADIVFNCKWDSMTSKVFPTLTDSVVLWFLIH